MLLVFDEIHLQTIQHNLQQKTRKKILLGFFAHTPNPCCWVAALIDAEVRKLKNL